LRASTDNEAGLISMVGLLSQIQGYFKATYSGRYFAHLVAELFRQKPKELSKALAKFGLKYTHKKGDRVEANTWRFPGKKQERIADIAILESGDPRVLVEIKDADAGKEGNEAQIDDYLRYIEQHPGVEFLFLSRHIADEKNEGRKLGKGQQGVHQKLFRDLYKALTGRDPFTHMLKEYLEDTEVAYEREIDRKTVNYITERMLGGRKRKVADKSLSTFFNAVFSELSSLGDWVQAQNKGRFKLRFGRHIWVDPLHDIPQLKRLLESKKKRDQKRVQELKGDAGIFCKGGEVCFYNSGLWKKGRDGLYVEFGYFSDVDRLRTTDPKYEHGVYASFEWKPWKDDDWEWHALPLKTFPHGKVAEEKIRECFRRAKAKALKRKDCSARVKQTLQEFRIP
jgi:hypothetical protein